MRLVSGNHCRFVLQFVPFSHLYCLKQIVPSQWSSMRRLLSWLFSLAPARECCRFIFPIYSRFLFVVPLQVFVLISADCLLLLQYCLWEFWLMPWGDMVIHFLLFLWYS